MKERRLAAATAAALVLLAGCGGYTGERPPEDEPGVANGQGANGQGGGTGNGPAVPDISIPPSTAPTAPATSKATQAPTSSATKKATDKSDAPPACTLKGRIDAIGFSTTSKARKSVTSFRVTLTQGTLSRTAWTPDDPKDRHGLPLVPGVLISQDGNYTFVLGGDGKPATALPGPWNATTRATLLIEGLAGDGRSIYQQYRGFTFTKTYPNGKQCDKKPALSFGTRLTESDRISKG